MPVHILVIDDDALSREVFVLLLEGAGYSVEALDSGDAALSRLQKKPVSPQVILADLQMPGMAGNELARSLRTLCGSATIILAMSASAPQDDSAQDFDGFLLKPFTMESFAAALTGQTPAPGKEAIARNAPILDESVYRKLSGSMRPQQLEQLYALCLSDIDSRVKKMQLAASSGDNATYRSEAHAIKGSCGMVGAMELQSLATSMEKNGLTGNNVVSFKEFLVAAQRLRRMLIAREISNNQGNAGEDAR
jgi:CheY-like chemotaxis protein